MRLLITGGAGFIGSNFVHYMLSKHSEAEIVVLDKLTYAGNMSSLKDALADIEFVKGDICDEAIVKQLLKIVTVSSTLRLRRTSIDQLRVQLPSFKRMSSGLTSC